MRRGFLQWQHFPRYLLLIYDHHKDWQLMAKRWYTVVMKYSGWTGCLRRLGLEKGRGEESVPGRAVKRMMWRAPCNRAGGQNTEEECNPPQPDCQQPQSGRVFSPLDSPLTSEQESMQGTVVQDPGSIPGLKWCPGEANGNPLQYPCLENPMGGGTWWATVHGVAKSWTQHTNLW